MFFKFLNMCVLDTLDQKVISFQCHMNNLCRMHKVIGQHIISYKNNSTSLFKTYLYYVHNMKIIKEINLVECLSIIKTIIN